MVSRRRVIEANTISKLRKPTCKPAYHKKKKINMLLSGLGSVRVVKNCDLGLDNAALGAAVSGSIIKTSVTVFPFTDL